MSDELKNYLGNINYEIETSDIELKKLDLGLNAKSWKELLDYITNLEEEVNKLTAESTEWEERTYCWQGRAENLEIIIDKAIKYINENKHLSMFADCREAEEDWNYDLEINPRELLNILKGGDE